MKKILLYTDTTQVGGAELQMFLLAKFLDKKKFTPILAASNHPNLSGWFENFKKEGIQVIKLNVKHKHDPKHLKLLKQIIKEEKIDLLHLHVWNPASCRYAYFASKKIPIITTEHDPFKLSAPKDIIKKRALKRTKKIITVSENNRTVLSALYPQHKNKISVIHNGIDITWWQSQLLRINDQDRKKVKQDVFQANPDSLIITCVAALHERKGQKYLINAMPEVAKKFPNIKVVLIGDGPEKNNLLELVKMLGLEHHVIILGRQKDIPRLLKSSEIFCLPSRREAFGLAILEAMAVPLPVIASKTGGIPEIIKDGNGILLNPENSEEIKKALLELIPRTDLQKQIAEEGQKTLLKEFEAKVMTQKYETVFTKALDGE